MKLLNGRELAGFVKERQARQVRSLKARKIQPTLMIIRNSTNPVIEKYVTLKKRYGEDIGVNVIDWLRDDIAAAITEANRMDDVNGIIVQLPLEGNQDVQVLVNELAPEKDVDGLGEQAEYDSATATAINWLLAGYNIELEQAKIALVGRGRLVGGPLERMWKNSGYDVTAFGKQSNLKDLVNYNVIVSATGVPHLITTEMIQSGAVIVDAGTASEGGVLVGDISDKVRERSDLSAITPKVGGVGPLTVSALFDHLIMAAEARGNVA